jgi:hypothetical protein
MLQNTGYECQGDPGGTRARQRRDRRAVRAYRGRHMKEQFVPIESGVPQ